MVELITKHQVASVRLKTQARWMIEIAKLLLALFAKGVEVFQGGPMEPLQTMVVAIRDHHLFMLRIIDDGVRVIELASCCISFLACGAAQERLLIHTVILELFFLVLRIHTS